MTTLATAPISAPPRTMAAAMITPPRTFALTSAPLPMPGPRQIRVRLQGCGVCASNVPPWEGRPWFNYPMAPGALGHEGWGIVDEVGDAVDAFSPGDRVAILSQRAYAEYDVAECDQAALIPPELADVPAPGEPLGCAMNIFRRSGITAGQTVAIIGIGFLGALLTQLAKAAGARVIAISRRPASVSLAAKLGADEAIPFDDQWSVIQQVAQLTGGSGGYDVKGFCDCVIECAGHAEALDLAGELCGVRGRLVIAGYHQDGPRQINLQLWNWRGIDVINAHEREPAVYLRGMREAIGAIADRRLNPSPLYSHQFPLERLGEALEMVRSRPDGFVKALINYER